MEEWKDIEGYEGRYQISDEGRVKSLGHYQKDIFGQQVWYDEIIMSPGNTQGYRGVKLQGKAFSVHRLVAKAFIPNPQNLPVVNHIDGDKSNNNVDNLEWCTYKENSAHAKWAHLLPGPKNRGKVTSPAAEKKIPGRPIVQYDKQLKAIRVFPSLAEAKRKTGLYIQPSTCRMVGGYYWEYEDTPLDAPGWQRIKRKLRA